MQLELADDTKTKDFSESTETSNRGESTSDSANTAPSKDTPIDVIFNPVSGVEDPELRKQRISDALESHGYKCTFSETTKDISGTELAKKALEDGAKLLMVCGGDGTVMQVLTAAIGTDIPVAVIPAGTGNLLSVNLGIPLAIPAAVETALKGRPYPLDLAKTGDDKYFAIMGGIGLDANMIADADRELKKRLGVVAYFLAAAKNMRRPPLEVEVKVDDKKTIRRSVSSVLVANMGKITGGVEAVPDASPTSGDLQIAIVKSASFGQWIRLSWYAFLGRTSDDPDYEHYTAHKVDIKTKTNQHSQLDGEDAGETNHFSAEVVPNAVQVMLPASESENQAMRAQPAESARHEGDRRVLILTLLLVTGGSILWWSRAKRKMDQQ